MITLNLKKHCIETEIKKQYNQAVRDILKKYPPNPEPLAELIEFLKYALETLDFRKLRSDVKELSGHTDNVVSVTTDSDSRIMIYVDGKEVDPKNL